MMSQFVRKVNPQKPEESKLTSEIIPRYTNFLYNHANMRGQFLCLNSKNEELFIMNRKEWTLLTKNGYQNPYVWIRRIKKAFYVTANPRDKKTGELAGYVQIVIPCYGKEFQRESLLSLIKERKDIPNPTYVIDNGYGLFDLVYMLKESVAPTMEQAIRAVLWTITEKIIGLERTVNYRNNDYVDFEVLVEKLTVNPKLRLPGSYNESKMVQVYYPKRAKQYTYHELLNCMGIRPPYKASYQIKKMKKSVQMIRKGKWLDQFYLELDKSEKNLDIFIQMRRIHVLEELMIKGYNRMTNREFVTEYCRLLCRVYMYKCYGSVAEQMIPITERMVEVITYLTDDKDEQMDLKDIVMEEVDQKFDFNYDSFHELLKNSKVYYFLHKYRTMIYEKITNNELIDRYHLNPDGSWKGKIYLHPTRDAKLRKPKVFIKDKIKNQMIAIARLTLQGLKNSEIMKKLEINRDRFFERKRRIKKEGGMKKIADEEFCFQNRPEQSSLREICRHPNSEYYQAAA